MPCKTLPSAARLILLITLGIFISNSFVASSQNSSQDTRGYKPIEYAKRIQNQISQKRARSKTPRRKRVVRYFPLTNDTTLITEGIDVGVTLWLLRAAIKTDSKEVQEPTRIAVRKKGEPEEKLMMMTPTRTASETVFANGDLLKLTIESPFEAYIYVISREEYVDGTVSDPYLIFPARGDVGISDKGFPGRLLFLPSVENDDKFVLKKLSDLTPESGKNAEKGSRNFHHHFKHTTD